MVSILELDKDLMRPGQQAVQNHGLSSRIHPDPRGIIDRHMDVSDPRRHGERSRPEHRCHMQVLRAILNHYTSMRQCFGQRRIDDDLRRWFVLKRLDSRWPTHLPGGLRNARRRNQAGDDDRHTQPPRAALMDPALYPVRFSLLHVSSPLHLDCSSRALQCVTQLRLSQRREVKSIGRWCWSIPWYQSPGSSERRRRTISTAQEGLRVDCPLDWLMAVRYLDIGSYRLDHKQQRNDSDGQNPNESKAIHKGQKTGLSKKLAIYNIIGRRERIRTWQSFLHQIVGNDCDTLLKALGCRRKIRRNSQLMEVLPSLANSAYHGDSKASSPVSEEIRKT